MKHYDSLIHCHYNLVSVENNDTCDHILLKLLPCADRARTRLFITHGSLRTTA